MRIRAVTRLAFTVALVVAVFVMHGASAEAGCPGGATMAAASTTMPGARAGMGARAGSDPVTGEGPARPVVALSNPLSGHGQVCVSTPPRPASAALLAPLPIAGSPGIIGQRVACPEPAVGQRLRAPPPYGAALLVELCVSRT